MLKVIQDNQSWYADGLRFECTGCGQCCTGAPGFVWVDENEIATISAHLNLTVEEFTNRYLRRVMGKLSLLELPESFDCIFLKDKKCSIYSVRPTQCRTYPWWPLNLKTEADWQEAARYCEGIRPEAPIVPLETITEQRAIQENYNVFFKKKS